MKELFQRDGDRECFDFYIGMALGGLLANPTTCSGAGIRMMLGVTPDKQMREVTESALGWAADMMNVREAYLARNDKGKGLPATNKGEAGGNDPTG